MADALLDNIARALAKSVSRRGAMKFLTGGVAAVAVALFGAKDALAADCKKNETACGSNCCPAGQVCVSGNVCCQSGKVCDNKCCPAGTDCVTVNGRLMCKSGNPSSSA